ncbi:carbamate kinase [Thermaerobacter marianensis DSM 12885]|uniref:Carbamate kinase n=1 Tax=Thermaerobacter marianensis (strain ATCC 700841 / DSM 12885 / JCM 10246 / 7p75a) TaxID=644966 RepID=E6SGD1_THEM7|nr:carbamate kinase [Thermaerobacter marianensis]ADU51583.1 carbamate kinase [Thermaerobacter marianensis DSM 12885]
MGAASLDPMDGHGPGAPGASGALWVVALGGNALLRRGQRGTYEEQVANLAASAKQLAGLVARGDRLVIVHGNGPQVGNLLIQQEGAAGQVPPMPLHACVAMTQGLLGFMLQQALDRELARRGLHPRTAVLITRVRVRPDDPAFAQPSKPVGPFYREEVARSLARERGWHVAEDAGRGWRRRVASPDPLAIAELDVIAQLVAAGVTVVAVGGGGIPCTGDGGVEAVIDKDLAAARLAVDLGAAGLFILTDVPHVALDWGTPRQRSLERVTAAELAAYRDAGHFAAGSMGPKVEAVLRFVEATGRRAAIGPLERAADVVDGRAGTQVLPATAATVA